MVERSRAQIAQKRREKQRTFNLISPSGVLALEKLTTSDRSPEIRGHPPHPRRSAFPFVVKPASTTNHTRFPVEDVQSSGFTLASPSQMLI